MCNSGIPKEESPWAKCWKTRLGKLGQGTPEKGKDELRSILSLRTKEWARLAGP